MVPWYRNEGVKVRGKWSKVTNLWVFTGALSTHMFIRSLQSGWRDRQGKIGRKELFAPRLWGWDLYRPNISHLTTSWTGWIKSGRNWPLSGRKDSWTIISYLQHKADQRHKRCICFLGMVQRFCALAQVADSYGRHPVIRASLAANFRYCRRQQGSVCRIMGSSGIWLDQEDYQNGEGGCHRWQIISNGLLWRCFHKY